MATTDSPSAMITRSPCRSTKCSGTIRNEETRPIQDRRGTRYGITICSASAANQSMYRAVPWANPPASTNSAELRLYAASQPRALPMSAWVNSSRCTLVTTR